MTPSQKQKPKISAVLHSKKAASIVAALLFAAGCAVGGYFLLHSYRNASTSPTTSPKKIVKVTAPPKQPVPAQVNIFTEKAQSVIASGGDINQINANGRSFLIEAVLGNSLSSVKFLVSNGANINKEYPGGNALAVAASNNKVDILRYFIEQGADINAISNGGTPLCFAAEGGHLQIVEILYESGADIEKKCLNQYTPLALAAYEQKLDALKYLIEKGAKKDLFVQNGSTLISLLALSGKPDAIKVLTEAGANLNLLDKKSMTALDWAEDSTPRPSREIAAYLKTNGAKKSKSL